MIGQMRNSGEPRCLFVVALASSVCSLMVACGDDEPTGVTSADPPAEFTEQRLAWNGDAYPTSCIDHTLFEVELLEEYSDLIGEFEVTRVVPADVLFRLEYGDAPLVEECDGTVGLGMDITLRPIHARVRPTALESVNEGDGDIIMRLTAAEFDSSWYTMVTYDENGEIYWYNDGDGEGRIYVGDRVFLTAIYSEEEEVFSTTGHPIIFEYEGQPLAVEGDEFAGLGCFELEWPVETHVAALVQRERDLFSQRESGASQEEAALGTFDTPRSARGTELYEKRRLDMTGPYFRRAAQCFPDIDEEDEVDDPDE